MAGRNGRPSASSNVAPCIWPASPTPRTPAVSRGCAVARSSTAPIAASAQASGSCSDQSGAGCDSVSSHEAVATIAPASFTSTAFTPDVPMSIPRYTHPSLSTPKRRANYVAFPAKGRIHHSVCRPPHRDDIRPAMRLRADCPSSRYRSGFSPVRSRSVRHGQARAARVLQRAPRAPGFVRWPHP